MLLLREVLAFSAAEVAEMLETTTGSVNSTMQRARARVDRADLDEDRVGDVSAAEQRAQVNRYVEAFERADVDALKRLLTEDAVLEMQPVPLWFRGRDDYAGFLSHLFEVRGAHWRMLPTATNGQPAVAAYLGDADGSYWLHTLQVFSVAPVGLSRNVVFQDPAVLGAFALADAL